MVFLSCKSKRRRPPLTREGDGRIVSWHDEMNEHTERKRDRAVWISIVTLAVGLLLAIAIPSFVKSKNYITSDAIAGVPPTFQRGSIIVTNGTTGCMVAGAYLPATNELWLTRGSEEWRITLEAGESCLQILGASGANRVFVLTQDNLTVKWSDDGRTVLWQTHDFARLLELTLPQAGTPLSSATVKELWVRDDSEDSEMRSWVHKLAEVSPDGTKLRAERAMPRRIPGATQWQHVTMEYDVDKNAWRPD